MSGSTALLIIDVQNLMFAPDNPAYDGEALLARLSALIAAARNAATPLIYVQHCDAEGSAMAHGTVGWEIHPAITPEAGDTIVQKRHPDAFHNTSLQGELEARGIRRLVAAGLQTELCVDTTCRRAFSLGYEVTLVSDGHSTWDTDLLSAAQVIAHHNRLLGECFVTPQQAQLWQKQSLRPFPNSRTNPIGAKPSRPNPRRLPWLSHSMT
jgi:nicotinamidase-related amidase